MLAHAAARLRAEGRTNVSLARADNRRLPVRDACADLALEGWSFGHLAAWHAADARAELAAAVGELLRVLRPGGVAIAIETLGTGNQRPAAPGEAAAAFYAWLERERGFARVEIRTDYRFASNAEAVELVGFFFGAERAAQVEASGGRDLPECTGVWWRQTAS